MSAPHEKRIVVLIPTERDMTRPDYLEKYWPNFVCHVKDLLKGCDCKIIVGNREADHEA